MWNILAMIWPHLLSILLQHSVMYDDRPVGPSKNRDRPMLPVIFITLEFSAGTFSGNGIYAQSQVRALASIGHRVLVISGKPREHQAPSKNQGAEMLIEVGSPDRDEVHSMKCFPSMQSTMPLKGMLGQQAGEHCCSLALSGTCVPLGTP